MLARPDGVQSRATGGINTDKQSTRGNHDGQQPPTHPSHRSYRLSTSPAYVRRVATGEWSTARDSEHDAASHAVLGQWQEAEVVHGATAASPAAPAAHATPQARSQRAVKFRAGDGATRRMRQWTGAGDALGALAGEAAGGHIDCA